MSCPQLLGSCFFQVCKRSSDFVTTSPFVHPHLCFPHNITVCSSTSVNSVFSTQHHRFFIHICVFHITLPFVHPHQCFPHNNTVCSSTSVFPNTTYPFVHQHLYFPTQHHRLLIHICVFHTTSLFVHPHLCFPKQHHRLFIHICVFHITSPFVHPHLCFPHHSTVCSCTSLFPHTIPTTPSPPLSQRSNPRKNQRKNRRKNQRKNRRKNRRKNQNKSNSRARSRLLLQRKKLFRRTESRRTRKILRQQVQRPSGRHSQNQITSNGT